MQKLCKSLSLFVLFCVAFNTMMASPESSLQGDLKVDDEIAGLDWGPAVDHQDGRWMLIFITKAPYICDTCMKITREETMKKQSICVRKCRGPVKTALLPSAENRSQIFERDQNLS